MIPLKLYDDGKGINYQGLATLDSDSPRINVYDNLGGDPALYNGQNAGDDTPFEIEGVTAKPERRIFKTARKALYQVPPVILGTFINLLDVCTFGTVFFPANIGNTGGLMIEMLALTTVIAQVIFIFGSEFKSMMAISMIDNIPFIHTLAQGIHSGLHNTNPEKVLPTVLVAMCVSVLLNGILFLLVGLLKMGNVLHFFPRYVILGMIFGLGVFMFNTGYETATGEPMSLHSVTNANVDM
jgi:MFS superfamily sulfate permease-like transporter